MKTYKKNTTIFLFILISLFNQISFAEVQNLPQSNEKENRFNLTNFVDSFIAQEDDIEPILEKEDIQTTRANARKSFIQAATKFNQGNIVASLDEYSKLIDNIENDQSMLALTKALYESGFFSLAKEAQTRITNVNQFADNIEDLKKSYEPKAYIKKEDEIFYAKIYSSIYFDNSAKEALDELIQKKAQLKGEKIEARELQKNDYYFYLIAIANFELKKYNDAINNINKSISLNPENINYQVFKIDALIANKKYKDALNLIKKLELTKTIYFADKIQIKKEIALANTTKGEKEKKFHIINKNFLEGNFEKSKKDCANVLNFDKDNSYILSLYAKNELATGNIDKANSYYVNSYKLQKNNLETIVGLADIKYLHGDFKNATKLYKKAYNENKNDFEILLKLTTSLRQYGRKQKELSKYEALLDKMPKNNYLGYYRSAISIAQNNDVLKEDFLKQALTINPNYENAIGELTNLYLKKKNFYLAKGLIYTMAFTLEKNYYYYYLCALYNEAKNQKADAISFYKTSLSLNPSFEAANIKMLKLIPDRLKEDI